MVCFRTAAAQSPHYASRKNNTPPRAPVSGLKKRKEKKEWEQISNQMFLQGKKYQNSSIYTFQNKTMDAGRLEQAAVSMKTYLFQNLLCQEFVISKKKTVPGFVQLRYGIIFRDKTTYFSFVKLKEQNQEPVIREQKWELLISIHNSRLCNISDGDHCQTPL